MGSVRGTIGAKVQIFYTYQIFLEKKLKMFHLVFYRRYPQAASAAIRLWNFD
jgi:hypothetical protein